MRIALLLPKSPSKSYLDSRRQSEINFLLKGLVDRGVTVEHFFVSSICFEALLSNCRPMEYAEFSDFLEIADEFDVIHNHAGLLPLTYSTLIKTPIVTTMYDYNNPELETAYARYNGKNYFISLSEIQKSDLLDYYAIVRPGIDFSEIPFEENINDYLLISDLICRGRGIEEAIELATRSQLKLLICGFIYDSEYFRQLEPILNGQIEYAGNPDADQLRKLISRARAVIHKTSLDSDWVLSEANAHGTPVLAFRSATKPHLLVNGVNGFLVSNIDEAVGAISNIASISRENCRRLAETNFSHNRMIDEYYRIYQTIMHENRREEKRPWGYYKILQDVINHKVKEIVMFPGNRLSLQRHKHRAEHWLVVAGKAEVILNNRQVVLESGQSIDIPVGALHRIGNPSDDLLIFIEVQTGSYFGEDDIERFEDDFGRLS